jgi:hypothetical protein
VSISKEAFAVNLYQWSVAQTSTEVEHDFPWLREMKSFTACEYVEYLRRLSPEARLETALAMVKRLNLPTLNKNSGSITSAENRLVEKFMNRRQILTNVGWGIQSSAERQAAIQNCRRIDKRTLESELSSRMERAFGTGESLGSKCFRYTVSLKQARLYTLVDLGGRVAMKYRHIVTDEHGKPLHEWVSFLQWHGIASQTSWDSLCDADLSDSVDLLVRLCIRFSQALPALLQ